MNAASAHRGNPESSRSCACTAQMAEGVFTCGDCLIGIHTGP